MTKKVPKNNGDNKADFNCRKCGDCCYGRGGIRLDAEGISKAASLLKLPLNEFRHLYLEGETDEIGVDKSGYCRLSQQTENGKRLCLIHGAKPYVCRNWPFLFALLKHESAFYAAQETCRALKTMGDWQDFLKVFNRSGIEFPQRKWP